MDETQWPGLLRTIKLTEPDPPADDEDLTLGYSFLRALAEHDATLVEVEPGVWRAAKGEAEREL